MPASASEFSDVSAVWEAEDAEDDEVWDAEEVSASEEAEDASAAEDAVDAAEASETALLLSADVPADDALPDAAFPLLPHAASTKAHITAINDTNGFFFMISYPSFQAAVSSSELSEKAASKSLYVLISVTAILRYSFLASMKPGVSSSAAR